MVQNVLWLVFTTKIQSWFLNPGVDTSFPHTWSSPWYSGHSKNFSAELLSTPFNFCNHIFPFSSSCSYVPHGNTAVFQCSAEHRPVALQATFSLSPRTQTPSWTTLLHPDQHILLQTHFSRNDKAVNFKLESLWQIPVHCIKICTFLASLIYLPEVVWLVYI